MEVSKEEIIILELMPYLFYNRMLNYMENNFDDIIDDFLYGDRKPTKDMITRAGLKFRDCFKKGEMDTFFTENSKDVDVISLRQSKEFSHLFMLMYLCYVKKVVSDELEEFLKFKWKEVNVGFVMCIQKTVLDSMNISKHELLHELPAIDSIFEETTEKSKLRIMIQGEVVSPAIQQNLKLPLKIKSYFVLAQLYENYVQLTLQHVVKDADSKSEYVSAIVVEDKIVPIANVNDKLHENIWRHLIKVHCKTNHTYKKDDTVCDLFTTEKYKEALKMLKPLVSKIFGTTFSSLDLDKSITIEICNHNYYLTLRRVIEVCMRPILQNIANVISSSLDNIDLFKNYPVTNVFIMGNVFNIIEESSLYPAVTLLLQQLFDENILYKERDTLGFVMKESLLQLLHPVIGKRLHLLDSFVLGDLQQISRESYGIYLKPIYSLNNHTSETLLSCINRKGGVTRVFGEDYATVILLKGQSIPITGITVRFEASNIDKKVNAYMLLIGMVKVSTDTLDQRKAGSFDKRTFDIIDVLRTPISDRGTLIPPVTLEIRYVNHVSSLQFSMRLTGEDKPKDVVHMVSVEEKLTVTYL
ncbi:uncharacterized protein EV154DRAFT_507768 [Mucor mucedo]|uniref:uncharacterized protein n=1 Tax=Mucor mucedo TaxID=29922 RepID=UPI00221EF937|nr:uncharacterized protein EV154DRAFT_507768 [Mucor mucedo]KAI7891569.1 hypothetical protein EV154DRAFT_507768 [Mucor mucedo]